MRLLRITFILATTAYWAFLAFLTHIPAQYLPHVGVSDKLEHFLAFGMLAGLLAMTCWTLFPSRAWLIWSILLIGMAYGAADELTQPLTGRTCDFEDWLADAVGLMAGILPVAVLQRFIRMPGSKPRQVLIREPSMSLGAELDQALELFAEPAEAEPRRGRRRI
jgi:VanZ family protein